MIKPDIYIVNFIFIYYFIIDFKYTLLFILLHVNTIVFFSGLL